MTWHQDAACRGLPARWWYPEEHDNTSYRAKRICADCPVRGQCLTEAQINHEPAGIWGGITFGKNAARNRRRQAA